MEGQSEDQSNAAPPQDAPSAEHLPAQDTQRSSSSQRSSGGTSPTKAAPAEEQEQWNPPHTAEGVCNTKEERLEEVRESVQDAPRRYYQNSSKEDICLLYVDNFRRQFVGLFPQRRPLFLTPQNEFGCEKVVCTTLRPTQLEYVELYDAARCAQFVKDFVVYEPLQEPCEPPKVLQSPSLTLQAQVGDCFDISAVLCSYLIGAGYDAFCVFGYAERKVTLLDQTDQACAFAEEKQTGLDTEEETLEGFNAKLLLEAERDIAAEEAEQKAKEEAEQNDGAGMVGGDMAAAEPHASQGGVEMEAEGGEEAGLLETALEERATKEAVNPYEVTNRGLKDSSYLKLLEQEKELIKKHNEEKDDFDLDDLLAPKAEEDELDPLQGQRVHCWVLVKAGSRGVSEDFFIEPSTGKVFPTYEAPYLGIESIWNNKNIWVNMQDPVREVSSLSLELSDPNTWEYVFIEKDLQQMFAENSTENIAEDLVPELDEEKADDEGKEDAEEKQEQKVLVLPPSWVEKLVIPHEIFSRRYGKTAQRVQLFHKCKMEQFAEFVNAQGLVRRVTLFKDIARTFPVERREHFKNRGDKLTSRIRYPLQNKVVEKFEEGQVFDLKELREIVGKSMELLFNSEARLDGLTVRKEVFGVSIQDEFKDRDDGLVERRILLGPVKSQQEEAKKKGRKNTTVLNRGRLGDFLVHKMTEKFDQTCCREGEVGISKRSFDFENGTIKLLYHYTENGIARSSILFHKDTRIPPEITVADNLPHSTKPAVLAAEFQKCLEAERNGYQSVRDACREMEQIIEQRKVEEHNVVLEKSVFDRAKEDTTEAELLEAANEEKQEGEIEQVDYLTPFLNEQAFAPTEHEKALRAKEACLKATKDRLLERASIIQSRLDEENALLAKKQAAYQRTRDHVDGADEEYENFCSETMFRIQILEQRLAQHEESALVKYAELDRKLREDSRLAILNTTKTK